MPNAIWDIWHVLSLLILITTLEGRYCYHPHFTEYGNLMRSQIQEVWELRFQPGSLPTPDPMPSTPLASDWQASGQSWSPLQAWDLVLLESVYLCNVNSTCGRWGHHLMEAAQAYRLLQTFQLNKGMSVLPWLFLEYNTNFFMFINFWSIFYRLISPQMN